MNVLVHVLVRHLSIHLFSLCPNVFSLDARRSNRTQSVCPVCLPACFLPAARPSARAASFAFSCFARKPKREATKP